MPPRHRLRSYAVFFRSYFYSPVWADSGESSLRQADTEDLYQSECVLRIEATIHDTKEELPPVAGRMRGMVDRVSGALHAIDACFIPDDTLEQLPEGLVGQTKVGGID